MTTLASASAIASRHISAHLGTGWAFGFDRAVRRGGACHHADLRITLSAHLVPRWTDDEVEQVLLHEIAHALAGARAAHGTKWLRIARGIGYTGGVTHSLPIAIERANWVGRCPNGHELVRFRRPSGDRSCAKCSARFDRRYLIEWERAA